MTQEIIAYLSDDGKIFLNKPDADFADYMGAVGAKVAGFLGQRPNQPSFAADLVALLTEFELWRIGGREGWERGQLEPTTAPPAIPEAAAEAPAPAPPTPRAKPGAKPKVAKERTAISEALEAARITQERKQAEARPGTKVPPAYRKHVGVVGLFNIHHANIEKEFGEALKLTIYDADCMPKLHGLRGCHKVVVMTKFISHKHVEVLKSIGQEPLLVAGGMDKLKEALTTIYVNS